MIKKRWITNALLSLAILFLIIGTLLFIRQHFIPFSSPENAYRYVYGGDTFTIVEGINSDYVIGNKDAKYLNKSKKGWTVPIINIAVTTGMKRLGSTTMYVSQYNFSDEYYLTIMDSKDNNLEIKDNYNSVFYKLDVDGKDSNINSCVYYAYVNRIKNDYTITVNGEEIALFE